MVNDEYIQLCAALNHATTFKCPYPLEWEERATELHHAWYQQLGTGAQSRWQHHSVKHAPPQVQAFCTEAYNTLLSTCTQGPQAQTTCQKPWWDYFLTDVIN
jgi:hypothetical protein